MYNFSVDYNAFGISDLANIHKYLMKKMFKACVPKKTEDLNLSVFNIITGINESKTLTKHISYEWK